MILLYALCIIFILTPFFPAIGTAHWVFRMPDFVRLQSILIEVILVVLLFYFHWEFNVFEWVLFFCLITAIVYQLEKVTRYSSLYPRKKWRKSLESFSILGANILQDNKDFDAFLDIIANFNPDLVLAMETDKDWERSLDRLEPDYPYSMKIPLENYYGMHLYSKKKLHNVSQKFQIEKDVPSIFCEIELEGEKVQLICLHPAPPSPTENETSKERDAELMLTGKIIKERDLPTVVCGDMNDVVWSRTTRLFKKMTGMIDPRVGRGFFPTYHAKYGLMRFPLDHLFHTDDLTVGTMKRTPYFGSDHFGMYYEIYHTRSKKKEVTPHLEPDEEIEVEEMIDNGLEAQKETNS